MNKQDFTLKLGFEESYEDLIFQITYAYIKHFNVNIYYSSFNSYTCTCTVVRFFQAML